MVPLRGSISVLTDLAKDINIVVGAPTCIHGGPGISWGDDTSMEIVEIGCILVLFFLKRESRAHGIIDGIIGNTCHLWGREMIYEMGVHCIAGHSFDNRVK